MRLMFYVVAGTLCTASASCSSTPRERRGALAPAADSIAAWVHSLACNGPDACFGMVGDSLGYFETSASGEVQFVAWRRPTQGIGAERIYAPVRDSLDRRYGEGRACPANSVGPRVLQERQWVTSDGQMVLIVEEPRTRSDTAAVTLIRRLRPAPCGVVEEPKRFM